jgi:UDP-glucose 4-epimerase
MLRSVDISKKRVVVTGATGFLGGHVLKQLQRSNATVIAVADRTRSKQDRQHPATSVETIWFDQSEGLAASVKSAKPDYVVHLHAAVTTNRSLAAVRSTVETNLLPSLDLMSTCLEMPLKRLILIGSGEEFSHRPA